MKNLKQKFDYVKINLASPERIKEWAEKTLPNGEIVGEVTQPETINYRTHKPEKGGLFCEKIFGPVKNWECTCGLHKYKTKDIFFCEVCGVELTEARVRRHRMGYIKLLSPVVHIWYLKGSPSLLSAMLASPINELEAGDAIFAAKKFNEVEILFPQSEWAPKSTLMAAYAYYAQDYYFDTIEELKIFLKNKH